MAAKNAAAERLRARLAEVVAGRGTRPRGNAVTLEEFESTHRFADACGAMANSTMYGGARARNQFGEDDDAPPELVFAPSEALPPLP
jgi:hypothetical protein